MESCSNYVTLNSDMYGGVVFDVEKYTKALCNLQERFSYGSSSMYGGNPYLQEITSSYNAFFSELIHDIKRFISQTNSIVVDLHFSTDQLGDRNEARKSEIEGLRVDLNQLRSEIKGLHTLVVDSPSVTALKKEIRGWEVQDG